MTRSPAGPSRLRRLIASGLNAPWYPALVPAAFVIAVWQKTSFDAAQLTRPIAAGVLAGLALTALAVVLTRNRHHGGAVAGLLVVAIVGGDDLRIAALACAALGVVLLLVWRERAGAKSLPWPRLTSLANLIAVVMFGTTAMGAAPTLAFNRESSPPSVAPVTGSHGSGTIDHPDIVILLLDAHGREDLLAEGYGEDVSGFLASLRARGFEVSSQSRSNYMNTRLTLTSMFNFTHVKDLGLPLETISYYDPAYDAALRERLDQNSVFRELRAAGYRIGTVTPGYDGAAIRTADVFLDGGQITELELTLVANSLLRYTLRVAAPDAFAGQVRARITWNLTPGNWLPSVAASHDAGHPMFLFVHVPSPHRPYVFGRDGTPTVDPDITFVDDTSSGVRTPEQVSAQTRAYADQLVYTDDRAIEAIDELLLSMPSNCVVIVMSDHGPGVHIDWQNLETTDSRERFGTLFAARTPGWQNAFGDAPTLVNLFPTLLNHYLGLTLPTRPDSSFLGIPPRQHLIDVGNPDAGR